MSTQGLESIDHTVQLTHSWINELDQELAWNDKSRSYRLLRAVLHGVRDWLRPDESADFAAQLPTLLRGVYYEQWRPATTPVTERSRAAFIDRIDRAFAKDPIMVTEEAVSIAFSVLNKKISAGEIEDVRSALPADLRALWQPATKAA
ncbi:MAG: DUF2267 domain-containing protein [Pseudorhodoplanes sp.]|nr:DUF2267 domain-containing protein [Pseudorhodoplanes sp.]